MESKIGTYDLELRRLHSESEEKTRQLEDLCKLKTKLINENGELQSRLKILESNVDELSRNNKKNLREIENLKATIEEDQAVRNRKQNVDKNLIKTFSHFIFGLIIFVLRKNHI